MLELQSLNENRPVIPVTSWKTMGYHLIKTALLPAALIVKSISIVPCLSVAQVADVAHSQKEQPR